VTSAKHAEDAFLVEGGVLVRHLVMPGQLEESAAILEWLAREVSPDTYVNLMGQYRPDHRVGEIGRSGAVRYEDVNRCPRPDEMRAAYAAAQRVGLWRFDEARWQTLAV
jgi:putative pyruvate formate lyase activating enzyme